ncbi:hypothetical protein TRVL_03036 [Trypanosoma vivax]|nr:hypothetical protein TRVL_03036 [Trypanosoma vivax]
MTVLDNYCQRKGESGRRLSPRLPRSPLRAQPSRDIYTPKPVSTRNPVSRVVGRGNVSPRGPNTLFLQRLIDKRRLTHQHFRMCVALWHYIHYRCAANSYVPIFRHRFSKGTERE